MKKVGNYEKACNSLVKEFCRKQEIELEFWVAQEIGGVANFGDWWFSMNDICYDMKNNCPAGQILDWHEYITWKKDAVNYSTYSTYCTMNTSLPKSLDLYYSAENMIELVSKLTGDTKEETEKKLIELI